MLDRLKEIITNLCQKWEVELLEFQGASDHVHLLIELHPNIIPSKFINNLQTVTSRLMRKEFAEHLAEFYWKPVLWTRAYCLLSTGGATIDTIRQYIEKQERPDYSSPVLTSPSKSEIIGGELRNRQVKLLILFNRPLANYLCIIKLQKSTYCLVAIA